MRKLRIHAKAFCAAVLLSAVLLAFAVAQQQNEVLPDEIAAVVQNKQASIEAEMASMPNNAWAGRYKASDGFTTSTFFSWAPVNGFTIWRESCSCPGVAQVNYGGAVFTEVSLNLTPNLTGEGKHLYKISSEFIPVKWGEQHYLIPADEMILFCYAINSKSEDEIQSFLIKEDDYQKQRKGLPIVPDDYKKYLGIKPVKAVAITVGAKDSKWYPPIVLSAGKAKGVVPGMKFYLYGNKNVNMKLEVHSVQEKTSEARVVVAGITRADSQDEIKPDVGWRFTSLAP